MTHEGNVKEYLSTKVIYFLPFMLLIPTQASKSPWWPFPSSGPIIAMFIGATVLLFLYTLELIRDTKRIKFTTAQKIFLLWAIHTFISYALVVGGFRPSLESIGSRIYTAIPPYFLAFMVFLTIEKNGWKIRHFENVIKVLLFVSAIWSIESFITFYLNYQIPGLWSIGRGQEWFHSGFTNSLHTVSKASLIIFWLSLYMFYMHRKPIYLLFALGAFLTIISNLNRATNALLIVSIVVFIYYFYVRYRTSYKGLGKKSSLTINRMLSGMLGFIAVLVIVGGGIFVNNFKGSLLADSHGFIERAYQYARATEIIMQFPYGTGAGLGYNFCYSEDVPQIYTEDLRNTEPFATFSKFYQSGILGADLQQRYVGEDNVYSIHNFSLNIIMDYGIIALIMLTIYIFTLFKFLRFSRLLYKSDYQKLAKIFMCITLAQGSTFVAMQATYKFFAWMWLLVFLYSFTKHIIKASIYEQRIHIKKDHNPLSEEIMLAKIY
tara:strand:- start:1539 stop:3011 length:1473 start_codon:yes stop_codon:yes gene_type:complete